MTPIQSTKAHQKKWEKDANLDYHRKDNQKRL